MSRENRRALSASRRDFVKWTAAGGFTTGLAGCLGGAGSGSNANTKTIVPGERDFSGTTLWWYDHKSGSTESNMAHAKEWASETGAEVNFQTASPHGLRDKEQTLFNSESEKIDIVGYPYQWGMQYTAGGHLADLSGYVERLHAEWERDDWIQRVWDIYGRFDGGFYALPTKFDLWLSFWNKDHFESAGLDPSKAPETWDDLVSYAETLDTEDHAAFDQVWLVDSAALQFLLSAHTKGVPFYDDNGYPAFWKEENRSKAVEAVEIWQQVTQHSSPGFSTMSFSESTSAFTQGKTSMVYKWHAFAPVMLDSEKSVVADALGMGFTAGGEANRDQMLGGWGAGLSKYSTNKEAAFDCLAYCLNKQNSLEGARNMGMSSARESVLQDEQVREAQPWTETALEALKEAFNRPKTLGWLESKRTLGEMMQTVLTEDVDVESELQKSASQIWEVSKRNGHSPGDTAQKP
jgi:ABC-type glycerol-3-phosphate transport system substrate-binding protein